MSLVLTQSFETGLSDGFPITAANSGGNAGELWDAVTVGVGGSAVYTAAAIAGSTSASYTTGSVPAVAMTSWSTAFEGAYRRLQGSFSVAAVPAGTLVVVCQFRAHGPEAARFCVRPDGRLCLCDAAGVEVVMSAGSVLSGPMRVCFDLVFGPTGLGVVEVFHDPAGSVPDETLAFVAADFFSPTVTAVDFGVCVPVADASVRLDGIVITDQGMPS